MSEEKARYGWESDFPSFRDANSISVREKLNSFIHDASPEQIKAWDQSLPKLQQEINEVLFKDELANKYSTILEYELPMESRRPDVILLINGAIVVLELKGKIKPAKADIDQGAAYARDLRCYHRECADRPVYAVIVPMLAKGFQGMDGDVYIIGPDYLDTLIEKLDKPNHSTTLNPTNFLSMEAYKPLPTIVQAARELIKSKKIRTIHRARSATEPALNEVSRIIHDAALHKERRLILITGVPGAGKTLVGLQTVHAEYLDDLSILRNGEKPTVPAIFLSGNGPLVEVLQYQLREAGGQGKVFVRGVKEYVKRYSSRKGLVPPEHVLVFDEAQRAFDADQVQEKHGDLQGFTAGKSEPEHFIEFAERIPGWCVVIGLIGSGQEIHIGEEGGLVQWKRAVEGSSCPNDWKVSIPPNVIEDFQGSSVHIQICAALNLDKEIRFHLAQDLHRYVERLLSFNDSITTGEIAKKLEKDGYHLRITRDLDIAKKYLQSRYMENRDARFGIIASSKDRDLINFGIMNDFQSTKRVHYGPWYSDGESAPGGYSCRHLKDTITEFGAQGLELDAALVAWGTDFLVSGSQWSNNNSRGYQKKNRVKNPFQLRKNSYRVLLTRGRDATVVYVPSHKALDETYEYLVKSGFIVLSEDN